MKSINFRDLGGIKNKDGLTVQSGLVYRTGNLSHIDDKFAQDIVTKTSANLYIDFRHSDEVVRFGRPESIIKQGVQWKNLEIDSMDPDFVKVLRPQPEHWSKLYQKLFENNLSKWTDFLNIIADANKPLVYGCLFGKDRTGIATALLLESIDVDEETIVTNFSETTDNIQELFQHFSLLWKNHELSSDEIYAHFMTAHPGSMNGFLNYVRQTALADEAHAFTEGLSKTLKSKLKSKLLK